MAVRTTWTAGDVLTAADLTDTFGAKANLASPTFTGTPAAPTAAAGTNTTQLATTAFVQAASGLTLITTQSFSAVSSVSVNNCFTATYENYLLSLQCSIVAANGVNLRLRVGGADATGANYDHARVYGGTFSRSNNQATYNFNAIGTAGDFNYTVMDIMRPQAAKPTLFDARSNYAASGSHPLIWTSIGSHSLSTSYDGFTIYPDASTITGTVRVYGYRN